MVLCLRACAELYFLTPTMRIYTLDKPLPVDLMQTLMYLFFASLHINSHSVIILLRGHKRVVLLSSSSLSTQSSCIHLPQHSNHCLYPSLQDMCPNTAFISVDDGVHVIFSSFSFWMRIVFLVIAT